MLDALLAAGLHPRAVSGSSAGALVGGAFASGAPIPALAERLRTLRREDFWDPAPGIGLLAGRRFDRLLRALLPVTAIRDCVVPVRISAFDIVRRRTEVLADGDLVEAIRASCALPGLFHPVRIAGRVYWDGGVLDRPGLAGLAGEGVPPRVLLHHIASRSPWRRRLETPVRPGMITLALADLPRSGPFKLDAGRRAMEVARDATVRLLDRPLPAGDGGAIVTNC
jgi:NTE family protein